MIGFTRPKSTSSGANDKYSASYTLIDDSLSGKQFVTLNLFGNEINQFPMITSAGNILRCTNLRKKIHKDSIQLMGNQRNIQYSVFYDKINVVTGYSMIFPVPTDLETMSSDEVEKENQMKQIEEKVSREDIEHMLLGFNGTMQSSSSHRWVVTNYQYKTESTFVPTSQCIARVMELSKWLLRYFYMQSMSGGLPLMVSNFDAYYTDSVTVVPPHVPLRKITRVDWGIATEKNRCDVVALVVQVILRENAMSELIVWDGTVS